MSLQSASKGVSAEQKEESAVHKQMIILGSGPAGKGTLQVVFFFITLTIRTIQTKKNKNCNEMKQKVARFPKGILGQELVDSMREQACRFGTECRMEHVNSVDFKRTPFVLSTRKNTYTADTVVIATGASAMYLGLENEKAYIGRGVSACATCDGFFFKEKVVRYKFIFFFFFFLGINPPFPFFFSYAIILFQSKNKKKVAVVGGGDTAMEESTFLTKFAKKVYVIHRRGDLRASKIMQERAKNNPKIEFIWDTIVTDVIPTEDKKSVSGLTLSNLKTQKQSTLPVQGISNSFTQYSIHNYFIFFSPTDLELSLLCLFVCGGFRIVFGYWTQAKYGSFQGAVNIR
ncbi:thioredoxin reductase [Reticulomyxa filosa]|uniref:Thioredoxin reductase n=1 Tax=Reticulomyxa filosa TaxID=46433 RepID=X6MI65_RETFI|nr:thioredoxin reductase [Reticulomyxa filosa]|eukprot:ETO13703.1 thioredoxin reductase [Reticulomyxa filosa]